MASAFLYSTILEICQKKYRASDYHEFPEIILESYPFKRGHREKIPQDISLCLDKLKKAGADLFCIACNSFHAFLPDVSSLAFVHLIEESIQEAFRRKISKALIFAAPYTIELKLYERSGLQCIYPPEEDQKIILKMIREVASGNITGQQADELERIIGSLRPEAKFDGVILACTELPLIHRKTPLVKSGLPIIDTVEVLAENLLNQAQ